MILENTTERLSDVIKELSSIYAEGNGLDHEHLGVIVDRLNDSYLALLNDF